MPKALLGLSSRLAALTVLLAAVGSASAQSAPFPSKPVRIVIPTAPGGNLDLLARIVAEKLQLAWGQQVLVESRAGANTQIATVAVAKSPADGYTALFTISGFVQNLVLLAEPPYKLTDFAPVSMVASFPVALAASTTFAPDTLADTIALAKQRPNSINFGSYGVGSSGHIIGQGLNKLAGVEITHVPYKGESTTLPDLVSGQLQMAYGSVGFFARQVPKVKVIAVASPQRLRDFPNVPTFAEAGYPEINLAGWGALLLPAGTPAPVLDKWAQEVRKIAQMPDVQKRIYEMGFLPIGNTRAEFGKDLTTEIEKWRAVVKASNIKIE